METRYRVILDAAEEAARGAGRIIMDSLGKRAAGGIAIENKAPTDLVTETDKACETFILDFLRAKFPQHKFIGEEASAAEEADSFTDFPTWFIDPLDGTTNYVHGYPFVCVCIGYAERKIPMVGVVFNPILDEMYTAAQDGGAFLNGKPIHVTNKPNLGDALIVNNIGSDRSQPFINASMARLGVLLQKSVRALRNTGSAAQNMCHVAAGVADVYFEDGYGGPWDVCAGTVIVREAGGVVTQLDGKWFQLTSGKGSLVCGHESTVSKVVECIKEAGSGGFAYGHMSGPTMLLCAASVGVGAFAVSIGVSKLLRLT